MSYKELIGIVGGLGPKASAQFYDSYIVDGRVKLFNAMKEEEGGFERLIYSNWTQEDLEAVSSFASKKKLKDQDHPPVILFSASNTADRTDFLTGKIKISPVVVLVDVVKKLVNAGATKICFSCNTVHYFIPEIIKALLEDNIKVEILNMIQLTLEYIMRGNSSPSVKVGLLCTLGTAQFKIYEAVTHELGINFRNLTYVYPTVEGRNRVQDIIYRIKADESDITKDIGMINLLILIKEIINLVQTKGCRSIILGCTELPLLVNHKNLEYLRDNLETDKIKSMLKIYGLTNNDIISCFNIKLVNPGEVLGDEILRLSLISRET